jgi:histidinol-phosphate aminotransferase
MTLVVPFRRELNALPPYRAPREGRRGRVRLDMNENTAGPAARVLERLRRLDPACIASYPEYAEAERELARRFGVRPGELLLTAGADDALRLLADAFLERGARVLIVEPTFALYRWYSQRAGARVAALRYGPRLDFPLERVCHVLERQRPRLFFLANPNNPTGTLLPRSALLRILQAARSTLMVVDEAYADFAGVSVVDQVGRPNLVVLRTFSKAAGLAGLRVGCLIAHREVAELLRRVRPPYGVSAIAVAAALAATSDQREQQRRVRAVIRQRQRLLAGLKRFGVPAWPSAANFVLADFGPAAPAVVARLERHGILVRDRSEDFGRVGPVRITVGTPAEMKTLLEVLPQCLGAR